MRDKGRGKSVNRVSLVSSQMLQPVALTTSNDFRHAQVDAKEIATEIRRSFDHLREVLVT